MNRETSDDLPKSDSNPALNEGVQKHTFHMVLSLYEHIPEPVLVLDKNATILYLNPPCALMLNCKAQDVKGVSLKALLKEDQKPYWQKLLQQAESTPNTPVTASLTIVPFHTAQQEDYVQVTIRIIYKDKALPETCFLLLPQKAHNAGSPYAAFEHTTTSADRIYHDIRFSKANLNALLDTTPQAYFLLDPSYKILQFNAVAKEYVQMIWGKTLSEGDSMLEYANPANREAFEKNFALAMHGQCISSERYIQYPNGPSMWYEIQYIPAVSDQNLVEAVVFTGLDITRRKESAQMLEKLSLVAQKTSNIVIITDNKGITQWVNEGFTRITGYSLEEAQGKKPGNLLQGPLSDKATIAHMSACIKRGEGFLVEIINYRRNGSLYWVSISVSPVYNDESALTGFIAIQSDITGRKKLEAQTVQHMSTLNAILASSKDMIYALDTSFRYLAFNETYAKFIKDLFNIKPEVGMSAWEVISSDDRFTYAKSYWDRALGGESFWIEEQQAWVDSQPRYMEVSYNPIYGNKREIIGIAVFTRDISLQKQTEKYLLTQNEQLQTINEQLDKFVYRAGHDLRAPLVSVLGLINIAQQEADVLQKDSYMELMKKSIGKLDHFIQDIIYFSRNSRTELSSDPIVFKSFIEDTLSTLVHIKEEKAIEYRIAIEQQETFYSDSKRLSVILTNLLANAIKYSNPYKGHSYIEIDIKVNKEQAVMSISDNGIGIEKEHIGKIFDMFYRATENKSGSGLGLSIVKETLQKLGGSIEVESVWGEGTRFTLLVPNMMDKG